MSSRRFQPAALARLLLELALATFTMWLVVQNLLLVVLEPWKSPPAALLLAGSLIKISATLIAALWPWALALLLIAGALLAGLMRRVPVREEVRHG